MRVTSELVSRVVAEVSSGADDPKHVASLVGAFLERQPMIGHYVQSFQRELGLEGVVLVLLHAHVLARCVELSAGRDLRKIGAPDLDAAARGPGAPLATAEPELDGYLASNVTSEDPTLGRSRDAALRILRLIARAVLDQP